MSQTSVPTNMTHAFAGMLADSSFKVADSMFNAESSLEMPFGVMVAIDDSSDTGALLPVTDADVMAGIVLHSHAYDKFAATFGATSVSELGTTGLKPKAMMSVLVRGRAWVAVEDAVDRGAAVFVRYSANGGNTQLGSFRSDADTSHAVLVQGARFLTSTTGAGFAIVEIDLSTSGA